MASAFGSPTATAASTEQFVLSLLNSLGTATSQGSANALTSTIGGILSSIPAGNSASALALQTAIGQAIGVAVAALANSNSASAQALVNAVNNDSNLPTNVKTGVSQGLQTGGQTFSSNNNSVVSGLLGKVGTAPLPTTNPVNTVIPTNPLCTTGSCH